MTSLGRLVHDERTNARLAWLLLGVTGTVAVREVLGGTVLWGLFGLCLVLVVAAPALATGDRLVIVPWPLPALAVIAGVSRAYGVVLEVAGYLETLSTRVATWERRGLDPPDQLTSVLGGERPDSQAEASTTELR